VSFFSAALMVGRQGLVSVALPGDRTTRLPRTGGRSSARVARPADPMQRHERPPGTASRSRLAPPPPTAELHRPRGVAEERPCCPPDGFRDAGDRGSRCRRAWKASERPGVTGCCWRPTRSRSGIAKHYRTVHLSPCALLTQNRRLDEAFGEMCRIFGKLTRFPCCRFAGQVN